MAIINNNRAPKQNYYLTLDSYDDLGEEEYAFFKENFPNLKVEQLKNNKYGIPQMRLTGDYGDIENYVKNYYGADEDDARMFLRGLRKVK